MNSGYQKYKRVGSADLLDPTTPDIEGPFYKEDSPFRHRLHDAPSLCISGVVQDQEGRPIPDALLDFWQANRDGEYDNEGFSFRGRQRSSGTAPGLGRYDLHTVKPGDYKISETEWRCAHIHVKVSAPGFKPLTTQLYFPGEPLNDTDHWFDESRVLKGLRSPGEYRFDFVLTRQPMSDEPPTGPLTLLRAVEALCRRAESKSQALVLWPRKGKWLASLGNKTVEQSTRDEAIEELERFTR